MAGFEGILWADKQMRYFLKDKTVDILPGDAQVYAVSRSLHYGLCLAFEGIRFYCRKNAEGRLEAVFLNWHSNLERFRRGISFNLSAAQQDMVPDLEDLEQLFIHQYFADPSIRAFLSEMADLGAQGYLRPFTVDEEQSIGVTFPGRPSIRAVVCRYDRYLGEPFSGVVIPNMVRAIDINGTGCLKLGINYLMSVKAVDEAKRLVPGAASALFLDDRPHLPLAERHVTEWDSSCCLFALAEGTVIKIPESNLILPSVTIQGITAILRDMGIRVEERHLSYGELTAAAESGGLVAACSIGTAGILNRCQKLHLVDDDLTVSHIHLADEGHELYAALGEARTRFWKIYKGEAPLPQGINLYKYSLV
jgi:branched-chain amino acid aminotransferase